MTDDQASNPYAPPASGSYPLPISSQQQTRWLTVWCVVHVVIMVIALGLQTYEAKTIVFSGVGFVVVGIIIAVLSRTRSELEFYAGLSAPVFAAFIVFLININNWSPKTGGPPIMILSSLYASVMIPAFLVAIVRQVQKHNGEERKNLDQTNVLY